MLGWASVELDPSGARSGLDTNERNHVKSHSAQPSGDAAATGPGFPAIDALAFARGLAVLRVFFGLILFSNGLAKLFSFTQVHVGIYKASLIDRPEARGDPRHRGQQARRDGQRPARAQAAGQRRHP